MTEDKPLLILKASAGSGKTYRLVEEFLKIILNQESDTYYQSVLALTFTNKAATEMKERIIEALETLSKSPREIGFDQGFLDGKTKVLAMSPDKIREKSKACLNEIIHNYGNLSVMTIDKFSHKIVRAFARDLELESDFGIELDTEELKREVIAEIIDSYGKDPSLSSVIYKYSQTSIEEGSVWNVAQNILKFSKSIENEKYEPELEELLKLEEEDFDQIQKELVKEVSSLEGSYEKMISEFKSFLESVSADNSDYSGASRGIYANIIGKAKKGIHGAETILSKSTHKKCYDKSDFGGKGGNASIVSQNSDKICDWIERHDKFIEGQIARYTTLKGILSKIYNIRLIKRIQATVDQLKSNKNIKEISDLNKEISQIILSESVPFIYERIGERYRHFLLDEFQDTSVRQWQNLIPLVENGISAKHMSLIVGDAKQSIYRFRNGEVEQFIQLPDLYNPRESEIIEEKRNYFKSMGTEDPLEDNWRSKKEIVDFNNSFFTRFSNSLPDQYKEIYLENLKQIPRKSEGGYVKIELKENVEQEEKIETTIQTIQKCLTEGFQPKDICIILRKKKKGVALALELEKHSIPVISDESLFVKSDNEVQLLVSILSLIEDPASYESRSLFAQNFLRSKGENPNFVIQYQRRKEKYWDFNLDGFLTDFELPKLSELLIFDSLVELVYRIKDSFDLQYEDNPYLQLFFEQVYKYEIKNAAYLKGFLEWWKEKGEEEAISIPESTNAIKIMTVHKSKGLQFPIVIVPFAEWGFGDIGEKNKDTLWVHHENGILDTFCIETKNPDKEKDQVLKSILQNEKDQMILDETNNLYVAFTRAIDRLYVYGEVNYVQSHGGYNERRISSAIYKALEEKLLYEVGEERKFEGSTDMNSNEISLEEKFSGHQKTAFSFKPVLPNPEIQYNIDFGSRLHQLLAKIEKESDLQNISSFLEDENIDDAEKQKLVDSTENLFKQNEVRALLFEDNVEVYSEIELIDEDGKLLRPDRVLFKKERVVVVDFKTGKPRPKDQKQIKNYQDVLYRMGAKKVDCRLLYVD